MSRDTPGLPDATGGGALSALQPLVRGKAPVKQQNWAENEGVRERVKSELIPWLDEIRSRRIPLNTMWASLQKVWTLEHETQAYIGRSNLYIPAAKKAVETVVSQLVSGTFPGEDFFAVGGVKPEDAEQAPYVKDELKQRMNKVARVRTQAEPFYRQLCQLGNSPAKVFYQKKKVKQIARVQSVKGTLSTGMEEKDVVLYDGPVFRTLEAANFYCFPEDALDLRECELVFEDIVISRRAALQGVRDGIYVESEVKAAGSARNSSRETATQQNLQAQGISTPYEAGSRSKAGSSLDITEVWMLWDPTAESGDEENPDECVPCVITVTAGGQVLRVQRNPFWHQRPPYVLGRMGTLAGRIYGTGYLEGVKDLNLLLNDQVNQTMDCGTYALNPIVLTNPSAILGKLPPLEPGAQWLVNDVSNAVKFDRPPQDLLQTGNVMAAQSMSWIQDFVGAPPVLSGGSAPGRAFKTATGIGSAERNAQVPLQEVIRLCEKDVWEPLLEMFYSLDQQYADDSFLLMANEGNEGFVRKTAADLAGNFSFEWLASTQATNQTVKGSQITQLLGVIAGNGMAQLLAQSGVQVNPAPLIRRLYTEVYGFRDADKVLTPLPPPPPPGMGGAPGQPPGAPGQPPMPPGAGGAGNAAEQNVDPSLAGSDDFQATREEADPIAAALGAAGGG